MEAQEYIKDRGGGKGFSTLEYTVHQKLNHLIEDIEDVKDRLMVVENWKEETHKNFAVLDTNMQHLVNQTAKIESKVDILIEKPARRWDTVTNTAITGTVSALIGAIISVILIKG